MKITEYLSHICSNSKLDYSGVILNPIHLLMAPFIPFFNFPLSIIMKDVYLTHHLQLCIMTFRGLPWWLSGKHCLLKQEMWIPSLGWEDPLEEDMETHSSILVWETPWIEEPGGL